MRADVLTTVNIAISVFGNVMSCSLVEFIDVSEDLPCLVFYPEDGRPRFLRNVEKFPSDYKVSQPRWQWANFLRCPCMCCPWSWDIVKPHFHNWSRKYCNSHDGIRSFITVFATASYLSDRSTYVYVFQALCFPSRTGNKTLPEFLPSPMHITCPTYLILLDFITQIISCIETPVRNSAQLLFCM